MVVEEEGEVVLYCRRAVNAVLSARIAMQCCISRGPLSDQETRIAGADWPALFPASLDAGCRC